MPANESNWCECASRAHIETCAKFVHCARFIAILESFAWAQRKDSWHGRMHMQNKDRLVVALFTVFVNSISLSSFLSAIIKRTHKMLIADDKHSANSKMIFDGGIEFAFSSYFSHFFGVYFSFGRHQHRKIRRLHYASIWQYFLFFHFNFFMKSIFDYIQFSSQAQTKHNDCQLTQLMCFRSASIVSTKRMRLKTNESSATSTCAINSWLLVFSCSSHLFGNWCVDVFGRREPEMSPKIARFDNRQN